MEIEEYKSKTSSFWQQAPTATIQAQILRSQNIMWQYLRAAERENGCITCSISGGSDSDVLLDFVYRLDPEKRVKYLFFDTGIEMQATKDHIEFLKEKYGVDIERRAAKIPVPLGCRKYGQPFLTKKVSDYIERLQKHGFQWEDLPLDVLMEKYPGCKVALRWWRNDWGEGSSFNIGIHKYLKEFMIENPPWFRISPHCCDGAKKNTADIAQKEYHSVLNITGIRRAEGGGQRATGIHNCFDSENKHGPQHYPLFFFKNADKTAYCETYGVTHSSAYTVYGFPRTGCSGCPFGSGFECELEAIKKYEPKLHKAACSIFADSYEYTRMYREFCEKKKREEKLNVIPGQMEMEDFAEDA